MEEGCVLSSQMYCVCDVYDSFGIFSNMGVCPIVDCVTFGSSESRRCIVCTWKRGVSCRRRCTVYVMLGVLCHVHLLCTWRRGCVLSSQVYCVRDVGNSVSCSPDVVFLCKNNSL